LPLYNVNLAAVALLLESRRCLFVTVTHLVTPTLFQASSNYNQPLIIRLKE